MGILKQAIKKNRQVEFERQAEGPKQQDFIYTPSRIKHLFTQASFYFGSFTKTKSHGLLFKFTRELATFAI